MRHKLLIILLISVILLSSLLALLSGGFYSKIKAQEEFQIRLPFGGGEREITGYVDHNLAEENFVHFNGQTYLDEQPYFYDGHRGMDSEMGEGTPILAAANGVVEAISYDNEGWGYYLLINHDNQYKTRYSHLYTFTFPITRAIYVVETGRMIVQGAAVVGGEIIAYSGNTGNSQGPHLDFEVMYSDNRITDPFGWRGLPDTDPLAHDGEDSLCLWANAWCDETYVEDGDVPLDGPPRFTQNGPRWTQDAAHGNQSGMRYTPSGNGRAIGRWLPRLTQPGRYEIYAFIPAAHATTQNARYKIQASDGLYRGAIDQSSYSDAWAQLVGAANRRDFLLGCGQDYVELTNDTGETTTEVGFDTVKFRLVESADCKTYLPIIRRDPTPTPTPTPRPTATPTSVTCIEGQDLASNGGLEQDIGSWPQWIQNDGDPNAKWPLIDTKEPYEGRYGIWLGGHDNAREEIYQVITLPDDIEGATVKFHFHITTDETLDQDFDFLYGDLKSDRTGRSLLAEPFVFTNRYTPAKDEWIVQYLPLTQLKRLLQATPPDRRVRLSLRSVTDSSRATNFFIDNVKFITECD